MIRRLGVEGFVFPRILESGKKKNKNLVTFESKGSIGILSYVYDLSHLRSLEIILKLDNLDLGRRGFLHHNSLWTHS